MLCLDFIYILRSFPQAKIEINFVFFLFGFHSFTFSFQFGFDRSDNTADFICFTNQPQLNECAIWSREISTSLASDISPERFFLVTSTASGIFYPFLCLLAFIHFLYAIRRTFTFPFAFSHGL